MKENRQIENCYTSLFLAPATLFIMGGYDYIYLDDAEVVPLDNQVPPTVCQEVASLPYPVDGFTGATIDGSPVVCGGWSAR